MKRFISFILGVAIFSCLFPAEHFSINLAGNFMIPASEYMRETRQKTAINPELKIGYVFSNGFSIWGGYGFITLDHYNLDPYDLYFLPEDKPTGRQIEHIISLGIGYRHRLFKTISYMIDIGLCEITSRDRMEDGLKHPAAGYRADGALISFTGKNFYAGIVLGYMSSFNRVWVLRAANFYFDEIKCRFGGPKFSFTLGLML